MIAIQADPFTMASAAACQAGGALAGGDTALARAKYCIAGDILKKASEGIRKSSEKLDMRFLAASQYYYGGDYKKALRLCSRIEERLLPPTSRDSFAKFFSQVRIRSSPTYRTVIRSELMGLERASRFDEILEVLKLHQYVLSPGAMAHIRGTCCEALRDYRTAAIFFADAARFENYPDGLLFQAAMAPRKLQGPGKLSESWDYMGHFLRLYPHPLMSATASLMCYNRALTMTGKEQEEQFRLQIEHFEKAECQLRESPLAPTAIDDVRGLMSLGFQAASLTFARLGDLDRAKMVADSAIAIYPVSLSPKEAQASLDTSDDDSPLPADQSVSRQTDEILHKASSAKELTVRRYITTVQNVLAT